MPKPPDLTFQTEAYTGALGVLAGATCPCAYFSLVEVLVLVSGAISPALAMPAEILVLICVSVLIDPSKVLRHRMCFRDTDHVFRDTVQA